MAYHIGIAGCGVAGLTAGLLLARQGHRVTIHEQAVELGPVGAGVLLQPSGQEVLRAVGLLEAVTAGAERIERLNAVNHCGKQLTDLRYGEMEGACGYGLERGKLFTVLHDAAVRAGVKIRTGERIVRYGKREEGVMVEEAAPRDAPPGRHGPYDFLLAADGARSALREGGGLRARSAAYPHGALWAMGPCRGVTGRLLQVCRGTRQLCGVLPTGGGRASLFWSARQDEMAALRQRGLAAWRREVEGLCPQASEILESVGDFEGVKFVTYMRVRMRRPHDECCLFLGDAAHAMSPHLGQGINLALIDGYEFAEALAGEGGFGGACRRYVQRRAAQVRAYGLITYLLSPFFQSRGILKGWARDVGLPLMPRIPWLRRQMIVTMSGCRAGLMGGRWRLGGGRDDGS